MDERPIGVFDSGVGGLTVVRTLLDLLPNESIVYYGDTARCPYGPRDPEEVRGFSLEIAELLVAEGVKMLVVACNAASSAGLEEVARAFRPIPVIGVVEPAVRAAVAATRNRRAGVIGTELTVRSGAYERAMGATRANVALYARACPRFVEFVERGEVTGPEIMAVAQQYLRPLQEEEIDTLILGCTHYPLLRGVIRFLMGREVVLIESDKEVAIDVFSELTRRDLFRPREPAPSHRFMCSGEPVLFEELGRRFLGPEIAKVEEHPWSS